MYTFASIHIILTLLYTYKSTTLQKRNCDNSLLKYWGRTIKKYIHQTFVIRSWSYILQLYSTYNIHTFKNTYYYNEKCCSILVQQIFILVRANNNINKFMVTKFNVTYLSLCLRTEIFYHKSVLRFEKRNSKLSTVYTASLPKEGWCVVAVTWVTCVPVLCNFL